MVQDLVVWVANDDDNTTGNYTSTSGRRIEAAKRMFQVVEDHTSVSSLEDVIIETGSEDNVEKGR